MTSDPPKYRPVERFWPYAELPEQPTDEELASLDPDLHEALFGAQPRPFSITLVFPPLDLPDFPEPWRSRGVGRVPRDRRRHHVPPPRALLVRRRRPLARLFEIVGRSDATDVLIDDRPVPMRASCGCRWCGS